MMTCRFVQYCVLAEHHGFTDEELDFIINYDIKYRMGRGAEEGSARQPALDKLTPKLF
jgi:hypothetical protein